MANGAITDEQISASSEHDPTTHSLKFGRLFYTLNSGAWVAKVYDDSQWIEIDLGRNNIKVTLVATQGRANNGQWVTSYKLQQSNDGANFKYYREAGQPEDKVKFKVVAAESLKNQWYFLTWFYPNDIINAYNTKRNLNSQTVWNNYPFEFSYS